MVTLSGIIFLSLILGFVIFWQSNARAHELANQVAEQVCDREQLQFLDGTTTLSSIRLKRDTERTLRLIRQFQFDFYNGAERLTGKITVSNHKITDIYIEKPLPEPAIKPTNLFQSANEVSNIIAFPRPKKKEDKPEA